MDIKKLKAEYDNIKASDALKNRIEKEIKKENRIIFWKRLSATAASVIIIFSGILNFNPGLVFAMSDIPVIKTVVRMLTFDRYKVSEGTYTADIVTPKIEGLIDEELEGRLNSEFQNNAEILIAAFEEDRKALQEEFGEESVHMGINSDYIIKTNNDRILALDVYTLYTAGSSMTKNSYYTVDKKTGELLTLSGMFEDGADYITPINAYINSEMLRLNSEENGLFWVGEDEYFEGFKTIKEDQSFYIDNNDDLVICFDKYEIAAGAQGCPEFVIPKEIIKDILK